MVRESFNAYYWFVTKLTIFYSTECFLTFTTELHMIYYRFNRVRIQKIVVISSLYRWTNSIHDVDHVFRMLLLNFTHYRTLILIQSNRTRSRCSEWRRWNENCSRNFDTLPVLFHGMLRNIPEHQTFDGRLTHKRKYITHAMKVAVQRNRSPN